MSVTHPAFDNLTDDAILKIKREAAALIQQRINELLCHADDYDIEGIYDHQMTGTISKSGATFRFEVEVFLTPQPLTD